jgi:molybdopterin-containing oxidoreductase family membrane subunit
MWFERFVIVITSLAQDFTPGAWGYFTPTWVDIGMLVGSFGLFMTLFLLFIRYLPVIAMAEIKAIMPAADPHRGHGSHHGTEAHGDE